MERHVSYSVNAQWFVKDKKLYAITSGLSGRYEGVYIIAHPVYEFVSEVPEDVNTVVSHHSASLYINNVPKNSKIIAKLKLLQ